MASSEYIQISEPVFMLYVFCKSVPILVEEKICWWTLSLQKIVSHYKLPPQCLTNLCASICKSYQLPQEIRFINCIGTTTYDIREREEYNNSILWFSVQYLDTIEIASCCICIWILSRMNYTNFICNSMFCINELFHEIALTN